VGAKEVLDSQGWLNMSSDGIVEFLDLNCLINIEEADLVRVLMRWGKFQLLKQDQNANLRSLILPGLRKIRFNSMNSKDITELFEEELGEVLTGDEKSSIIMAFISGDWKLMPTDVVSPTKLPPRHFRIPYPSDTYYLESITKKRRTDFW
jgi:BTB And C-terminal Kelch